MVGLRFLIRRLMKAVVIILGIAVANFILIHLAPGDPASVMAGEAGAADETFVRQLRHEFGLDQPFSTQLYLYLKQVARLNLGYSYRQKRPVADLILERLPATLLLTGTAYLFGLGAGIGCGALAAGRAGGWVDRLVTLISLVFYATPGFWIGLMAVLLFAVDLNLLPAFGMTTVGASLTGFAFVRDVAMHLILPMLTLGLFFVATYARLTRASMLEVQTLDFVKTARAKGLPPSRVTRAHVLRNAILPVITLAGIQGGQLVGGAIVTETVFAWPGIGRLTFDALLARDYSLLLGIFLVLSVIVILFNLVTDLVYLIVDPRIQLAA